MKIIAPHTIIPIMVKDQERALAFYVEKLGLEKRQDIVFSPGKRLLSVAIPGQWKPELVLAEPDVAVYGEERVQELVALRKKQVSSIFVTENCIGTYKALSERGVPFVYEPAARKDGMEALFQDLDGNIFLLIEYSHMLAMHDKYTIEAA